MTTYSFYFGGNYMQGREMGWLFGAKDTPEIYCWLRDEWKFNQFKTASTVNIFSPENILTVFHMILEEPEHFLELFQPSEPHVSVRRRVYWRTQ